MPFDVLHVPQCSERLNFLTSRTPDSEPASEPPFESPTRAVTVTQGETRRLLAPAACWGPLTPLVQVSTVTARRAGVLHASSCSLSRGGAGAGRDGSTEPRACNTATPAQGAGHAQPPGAPLACIWTA